MQRKFSYNKILRHAAMLVFLYIFVISSVILVSRIYGYWHDSRQYDELRSMLQKDAALGTSHAATTLSPSAAPSQVSPAQNSLLPVTPSPSPSPSGTGSSSASGKEQENPLPYTTVYGSSSEISSLGCLSDYALLKKKNNDLTGWIQMPGFKKKIDYPVMQYRDNTYYLKKDFYKNDSNAGSIFLDSRNNAAQPDRNLIIYGHAMRDFSMFGNLKEYPDKPELYEKLTKIYLDLMDRRLEYEVFSTYHESADYNYRQIDFADDAEYIDFLNKICRKSIYDYGFEPTPEDRIITLSTCTNIDWNKRTILHARLVRQTLYKNPDTSAETASSASASSGSSSSASSGSAAATTAPPEASVTKPSIKKAVSANVYLTKLSLQYETAGTLSEATFTPAFDTAGKEFSAELPSAAENITLIIKTADPEAACELTLNDRAAGPGKLEMPAGENTIKIKVTSRDGLYARTYTVKVTVKLNLPGEDMPVQP